MGSVMGEVEHMAQQMRDRIEALVTERDQWVEHTKNAVWSDSEELKLANDRIKGLEAALKWQAEQPEAHPFMVARALAALKGN